MATPLQQASVRRKLIYAALIVLLFTGNAFAWRGLAFFNREENGTVSVSRPPAYTVTATAQRLELSEADRGEADPTGSSVRLLLTGSRGLAVTLLWQAAIKKQEKHEWNELELLVRTITKLEPHFTTIWLFQSWNLAYNVSVESDRPHDKYFFISRGIELIADGERLNRGVRRDEQGEFQEIGNPDLRFWIGFYYQNKFGVSDEAITLRSLFQLSCIDPLERDPDALWQIGTDGRPVPGTVDLAKFRAFCEKHPQLVRRLHEKLRKKDLNTGADLGPQLSTPAQIVDFLAEHRKLPSRFYDPLLDQTTIFGKPLTGLKSGDDAVKQFPILPPRFDDEEKSPNDELDDAFENYQAARAWYVYSLVPLPRPNRNQDPAVTLNYDQTRYRIPRQPAMIIFRQYPARAQTYTAQRLQQEGWFDEEGWEVDRYKAGDGRWFRDKVFLGTGHKWGQEAWGNAYARWQRHGELNGLWMTDAERTQLEDLANSYRKRRAAYDLGTPPTAEELQEDPRLAEAFEAFRQLMYLQQNLTMTNFRHWLYVTEAEKEENAVQAQKFLHDADRQRRVDKLNPEVIEKYRRGFTLLKEVFRAHPTFRADRDVQEEVYEQMVPYVRLLADQNRELVLPEQSERVRASEVFADIANQAATWAAGAGQPSAVGLGAMHLLVRSHDLTPKLPPPFDDVDEKGERWIATDAISQARQRLGLSRPVPQPPPAAGGMPPGAPMRQPPPGRGPVGRQLAPPPPRQP